MGRYVVKIEKEADLDIMRHKKSGNKPTLLKLEKILKELSEHPYAGTGQPEQLKYNLAGLCSRRLNQKDRLIYEVKEKIVTVLVLSALGHSGDK